MGTLLDGGDGEQTFSTICSGCPGAHVFVAGFAEITP
jgi:hypothetical protein